MSDGSGVQLPLILGFRGGASFEGYWPGPNQEVVAYLRDQLPEAESGPGVFLWGARGAGKTHLLQALCNAAGAAGRAAVYLPMQLADRISHEALEGLEGMAVVCIDDIQAIAGKREWEYALFGLYNRLHESGTALVVAGSANPAELGLVLSDLVSRLAWGVTYALHPLDAADLLVAAQTEALRRGLTLPDDVGRYLLKLCGGSAGRVFAALRQLDSASMAAQRRLTGPFLRQVLGDGA